jgi:hypothetical protein
MSSWIYIGPDIPPLGLKRNTLYRDTPDPPPMMVEHIAKAPILGALYIPTRFLPKARWNLFNDPASVESLAFTVLTEIGKKLPR